MACFHIAGVACSECAPYFKDYPHHYLPPVPNTLPVQEQITIRTTPTLTEMLLQQILNRLDAIEKRLEENKEMNYQSIIESLTDKYSKLVAASYNYDEDLEVEHDLEMSDEELELFTKDAVLGNFIRNSMESMYALLKYENGHFVYGGDADTSHGPTPELAVGLESLPEPELEVPPPTTDELLQQVLGRLTSIEARIEGINPKGQ